MRLKVNILKNKCIRSHKNQNSLHSSPKIQDFLMHINSVKSLIIYTKTASYTTKYRSLQLRQEKC